ncbi:anti-sigma factor family protein [Streptomyces hypolithicus]
MNGTRPTSAEQHLGDRLAALVDGELSHDVRERVLSHLATCTKCKAEADAQRRLKSVFSTSAPPPPSEGLLARLQGLPGGGSGTDGNDDARPFGQGGFGQGVFGTGASDGRSSGTFDFAYAPATGHTGGFRVHDVRRAEAERSGGRTRRLAFAAASAVSLAAFALGGAVPVGSAGDPAGRGSGTGNNVTPLRTAGPSAAASDTTRRRGSGQSLLAASGKRPARPGSEVGTAAVPPAFVSPGAARGGAQGVALSRPFPAPPLSSQVPLPLIRPSASLLSLSSVTDRGPALTVPPSPLQLAATSSSGLPVSR